MVEFEWDAGNAEHVARHGVDKYEAEEALTSAGRVLLARRNHDGEHRWTYAGLTDDERLVVVVYCKRAGRTRVITARDPSRLERLKWQRNQR
jgi:uncharacterized protein